MGRGGAWRLWRWRAGEGGEGGLGVLRGCGHVEVACGQRGRTRLALLRHDAVPRLWSVNAQPGRHAADVKGSTSLADRGWCEAACACNGTCARTSSTAAYYCRPLARAPLSQQTRAPPPRSTCLSRMKRHRATRRPHRPDNTCIGTVLAGVPSRLHASFWVRAPHSAPAEVRSGTVPCACHDRSCTAMPPSPHLELSAPHLKASSAATAANGDAASYTASTEPYLGTAACTTLCTETRANARGHHPTRITPRGSRRSLGQNAVMGPYVRHGQVRIHTERCAARAAQGPLPFKSAIGVHMTHARAHSE